MRVANKNASKYVDELKTFQGSNTFAEEHTDNLYVVYSYGYHFPMYVKYRNTWYENNDKYSVSTSKQQSQSRPNAKTKLLNTKQLKELIYNKSRE